MSIIPHDSDIDLFGHLLEYAKTEEFQREAESSPTYRNYPSRSPEVQLEYQREYRKRYPQATRLRDQSLKYKPQLFARQNGLCAICGKSLGERYQVDHFIPITKGGTSDPSNLRVVHGRCNQSKGCQMPVQLSLF